MDEQRRTADGVDPMAHLGALLDVKLAGFSERISYEVASLRQLVMNQTTQYTDHEQRMRTAEKTLADIMVDRARLTALVDDVAEIKMSLTKSLEKMDSRVTVLEEWRWKVIGSGVLAGGVTAGLVSAVLQAVGK